VALKILVKFDVSRDLYYSRSQAMTSQHIAGLLAARWLWLLYRARSPKNSDERERERFTSSPTSFLCGNTPATSG